MSSIENSMMKQIKPRVKGELQVVIETPKNSRNKYEYNPELGIFEMSRVLPAGTSFPYDFGFLPNTLAEDGDPLDVLILMDVHAFPGCLIKARPIGLIEARQGKSGDWVENDRIVAVAVKSHDYSQLKSLHDMNQNLLEELEQFFVNYHAMHGKQFKLKKHHGPKTAEERIDKAIECFKNKS